MDLLSPKAKKEIEKWVWCECRATACSPLIKLISAVTMMLWRNGVCYFSIPHVCVCCVTRYLDPDMYSMMEDNSDTIRSTKFKKLTQAICGLVSEAMSLMLSACGSEFVTRLLLCVFRLMTTAWSDSSLLTAQMRKVLTLCYNTLTSPYSMEKTWSSRSQRWRNKQKHDTGNIYVLNKLQVLTFFSLLQELDEEPVNLNYDEIFQDKGGSWEVMWLQEKQSSKADNERRFSLLSQEESGHREMYGEKHHELSLSHVQRFFCLYTIFSFYMCDCFRTMLKFT